MTGIWRWPSRSSVGMRDERGATAVEYGLVVAAVVALVVTLLTMSDALEDAFEDNATETGCVTKTDGTEVCDGD